MNKQSTHISREVLKQANKFYTIQDIAFELEVNPSTVHRWIKGSSKPKPYVTDRLQHIIDRKLIKKEKDSSFRYVDLFAGIGGIRKGFDMAGGKCVFTCEWDEYAQRTYNANYPSSEQISGDITKIQESSVPDHDVLLAGFPCQPFSIAGVSKKQSLGRAHGFADETQGTLFFDVARIIAEKKPQAFVIENVKNLKSHDKGRTFDVIMRILRDDLKYTIDYKIIDGQHWVPQHRERVVIVGLRGDKKFSLADMSIPPKGAITLSAILHKTNGSEPVIDHDADKYFDYKHNKVHDKYTLTDKLWAYLQAYSAKHRSLGNGFGFGLVNQEMISRTLSARYYKDGSEILIDQGKKKNPRRLTPRECARLMGYPDSFIIPVSDTRAYKQFGNSVIVPLFVEIARFVKPYLVHH